MTIQEIEGYLADNYTQLSEEQIKDVPPPFKGSFPMKASTPRSILLSCIFWVT